jgi:hypothetical protein
MKNVTIKELVKRDLQLKDWLNKILHICANCHCDYSRETLRILEENVKTTFNNLLLKKYDNQRLSVEFLQLIINRDCFMLQSFKLMNSLKPTPPTCINCTNREVITDHVEELLLYDVIRHGLQIYKWKKIQ